MGSDYMSTLLLCGGDMETSIPQFCLVLRSTETLVLVVGVWLLHIS